MNPQIITRDLNVWIGKHHILKDVNVSAPRRKITVIMGPSGCGKTTLLKCFNRLIDLTESVKISGKVIVDGEDIFTPGVDVIAIRKKMGLLSQKPYPLPMSIYNNVAYGLRIHGTRDRSTLDDKVKHYLEAVGLWEEVNHRLKEPATALSIGQQQRLCLARGLAVEPEVILCDEPTSALDPVAAKKIEGLLVKLKADYTIILVTHVLRQAKKIADNVNFIYFGEIVEQGPAEGFFAHPRERLTQEYLYGDVGY
ncbi:MAG TPA: phosphate ABC transporter ATP-binding protein [bacterium]|nr:phosphate ABC transporter ATP-binding protein [bacterium]